MSGLLSIARLRFREGRGEGFKRPSQKCLDVDAVSRRGDEKVPNWCFRVFAG